MFKKLEQKLTNCKLNISKNFSYYVIAPIILMAIAIILVCTINWNLGIDFRGYSSFKMYVNNEDKIASQVYNLDNKEDYNKLHEKVENVLCDNGYKIVSYRTSTITINDYDVYDGQAIEVVFKNNSNKNQEILDENQDLREKLLVEFGYEENDLALTSVDFTEAESPTQFMLKAFMGIVLGFVLVIIYMLLRKYRSFVFLVIMQVALDLLLTMSLVAICRICVDYSVLVAIFTIFVISILNCFVFINKQQYDARTGKFESMNDNEIADKVVKELSFKKLMGYVAAIVVSIIFICLPVPGIRNVALAVLVGLITTLYTSHFLMPGLWTTTKRMKIRKKAN